MPPRGFTARRVNSKVAEIFANKSDGKKVSFRSFRRAHIWVRKNPDDYSDIVDEKEKSKKHKK